jgi:hypothetical protein
MCVWFSLYLSVWLNWYAYGTWYKIGTWNLLLAQKFFWLVFRLYWHWMHIGCDCNNLYLFVIMVFPEGKIVTLLPWGTQFSHTFFISVYTHFFQTSKGMLFLCYLEAFLVIHFSHAVRNCRLILFNMEYPLEVIRSLLCNLAWVKQFLNNCTFYLSVWNTVSSFWPFKIVGITGI